MDSLDKTLSFHSGGSSLSLLAKEGSRIRLDIDTDSGGFGVSTMGVSIDADEATQLACALLAQADAIRKESPNG